MAGPVWLLGWGSKSQTATEVRRSRNAKAVKWAARLAVMLSGSSGQGREHTHLVNQPKDNIAIKSSEASPPLPLTAQRYVKFCSADPVVSVVASPR